MGLSFHSVQIQEQEPALGTRRGTSHPQAKKGRPEGDTGGANGAHQADGHQSPERKSPALGPSVVPCPFPALLPPGVDTKGEGGAQVGHRQPRRTQQGYEVCGEAPVQAADGEMMEVTLPWAEEACGGRTGA